MFNDVPDQYKDMTQTLYDYNVTIYSLEGIGLLFIVLRSIRIISNLILQHLLPFKLIVLYKPIMLNLYYFCGMILVAYLRFGTNGTQIPFTVADSTNGKYYYFLGTNSDATVNKQPYLNANYTSVLLHDCDFTLFLLFFMGLIQVPAIFIPWPKIIKNCLIFFIEGSIFELTFASVGQISQNIYNKSTTPLDIVFSIIGGLLLIFYSFVIIRPILSIKYDYKNYHLNCYANSVIEKGMNRCFLIQYSITLFNELLMGILPSAIQHFSLLFYIELGINGLFIVFAIGSVYTNQQRLINIHQMIMYGLVIASYVLIQFENYQYGFIIMILLSVYFLCGITVSLLQILEMVKSNKTADNAIPKQQQLLTEQNGVTMNIELQSISLQMDQSQQINQTVQQQSKFMLTSQISNIHLNRQQMSQFNSQNTSTEIVREEEKNNNIINENLIKRQQCLSRSQFFDSGYVSLNKLVCQLKFNVKVYNKIHEIDPKILKRNNIGNKVKGIHTFILHANENCEIQEMQIKTYYSDQLLQRDIKLTNKKMQIGQPVEIVYENIYEQSEQWNEKLTIKITIDGKVKRFSVCNSEMKLIQIFSLTQKSVQKMMENGVQKYILLHEQRLERFNFFKVVEYCKHYNLYNQKIYSSEAEYRNQDLSSNFGKVQLILPGTPYVRLILSIEQQINLENLEQPKMIEPNIDLSRVQYVMVSVFAKKSSHQLAYGHKRLSEYFGQQLINYFNQ